MKNYLSDPTFYPFFLKKVQERLSGTTVMTIEQAEEIQRSIEYVLEECPNLWNRVTGGKSR